MYDVGIKIHIFQLTQYTRINSKWIKDLNISHDTIKILGENIDSKISDIPLSNIFTDISPRTREMKEKNKQMGHQSKKLLHGQRHHHQNKKRANRMGKHICQ